MRIKDLGAISQSLRMRRLIASVFACLGVVTALTSSSIKRSPALAAISSGRAESAIAHESKMHPTPSLSSKSNTIPSQPPLTKQSISESAEDHGVVEGNTAFALNLYKQLGSQKGNLFFSPYSTSLALAMTYAGARGSTATQMSQVLHFNLKQENLHPAFATLLTKLNSKNQQGFQLSIVNRLWSQKNFGFLDSFLQLTKDYYGAGLEQVDFVSGTEEARRTINKWVEQQTQQKIHELLAPGILTSLTRLVLTNAIYFKGTWIRPFAPEQTKNQPFTVTPILKIDVPMMHQEGAAGYGELDNLQVLELPYVGEQIAMVILLPKKVDGLAELEQQLTPKNLADWLSSIRYESLPMSIWLPKFKLESAIKLKPVLSSMGMPLAFDEDAADFSGINGKNNLFLQNVIHKTFVDVDEFGTEAAASTAAVFGTRGGAHRVIFRADHPFVFLIWDKHSGSILFLGRMMNPTVSNDQ